MAQIASSRRVAVITGAAHGIGKSTALRLAGDGFKVAVNDIDRKKNQLQDLVSEIREKGGQAIAVPADVSLEPDVQSMCAQVVDTMGGIDVMVANAATFQGSGRPLHESSTEDFDRIMAINLRGVMLSYKYVAQQMLKQGRGGRIIGASSVAGKQSEANASAYCAAKFGLRGLTHSLALEVFKHGITVNSYAPGFILTEMSCLPDDAHNGGPGSTILKLLNLSPDTPKAWPDVIASLISYLAKPESYYITGQYNCTSAHSAALIQQVGARSNSHN
ncbi:NAD(P)-binding protein [Wolfiporia cocos MD-104 SS10]|uniref:3-oxoacyl-[acyl-carrier-protein] reductase n=1 Tax=Wolfiporia cocos (strain MD-104) TaxID=742152 RepID=A0A2H3JRP0_WOLCO|nr:NAD(P)-binding protein [Wolfiporia cocos MD-104 SS10]